ncbi:uncharacterized protein LOC132201718 isoform X2 [Neocloeon triangulifer]|uniref:uncharacterized protein LOC132201718 isoform X2 n=1 Tax=Neocloeon triangulifer TaxID=2078957 RepID=UPI00286ED042|nr:uncharacterized protein LOC132201718 isoform X2 [Neocloeon triangulifer]
MKVRPNRCLGLFLVLLAVSAESKDLQTDVAKTQSHMADFMRAASALNSHVRQLYGIACLDFSTSVLLVCDQMTALQVPQKVISKIRAHAGLLEETAGVHVNALRETIDSFNRTLTAVNQQLIFVDAADASTINELLEAFKWNLTAADANLEAALTAMLSNGQRVENNVREATDKLGGPEIALIYELIGRCKAKFSTKEAEARKSAEILRALAEVTTMAINKVVEQLEFEEFNFGQFDLGSML